MSASTARHETRALLRAHLAAASGYGHLTRHCPICHRLLRLAMEQGESGAAPESPPDAQAPRSLRRARRAPGARRAARRPRGRRGHRRTDGGRRGPGQGRKALRTVTIGRVIPLPDSGTLGVGKRHAV
ncbi:hypothetical protein EQG64_18375 [Streptomyces sp. S6]|nr:hypothetical protein EQG64_18375 [Streptomyces sp. S6]